MKTCMVAIFVKDRYYHTKLCCDWLMDSEDVAGVKFEFQAFNDDSGQIVSEYLDARFGEDNVAWMHNREQDPGKRLALCRKSAVAAFLFLEYDYLLLLDNDIIVTKATIAEAIDEYEFLDSQLDFQIGGYTLHPLGHIENRRELKGKEYGDVSLTGDAYMLFRKDHLETIGNHFSAGKEGGFADNQIHATRDAGYQYMSRLAPAHQVQHIGFGQDASLCYKDKAFDPFWTARPLWSHSKDRTVINVENFDVLLYADLANKFGGLKAPGKYLELKGVK